jgi:hypothetical protein
MTAVSSNLIGILVGAAFVFSGGHALLVNLRGRRGTVRAEGTVLELEQVQGGAPIGRYGPQYQPVVEFTAADGRVVQFGAKLQLNAGAIALLGRRYQAGGRVSVRYRPEDPQQALLDTALVNWVISAVVLAAGLGILVVSALPG